MRAREEAEAAALPLSPCLARSLAPPRRVRPRSACYGVLRFVMESGAKGCEVIVSGKLRAQRAKSMKFKDGYMARAPPPPPAPPHRHTAHPPPQPLTARAHPPRRHQVSSGQPVKDFVDCAVRHVLLRSGVIGIKVKVMLDWDPTGKAGPKKPLPDSVTVHKPKEETHHAAPYIGKGDY